jgi:thioredoxin reductase
MAERVDVAIVGGGPAGQAAALQLTASGARVAVIDEQPRPGGQILRQPPTSFAVRGWMAGGSYAGLRAQLGRFEAEAAATWRGGRSVLGAARDGAGGFALTLAADTGVETLGADRLLVAAGCQDLAVPVPGWTLPGVYAAGGLQAFLKSQRIVPGDRVVLAGTHPLQLVIAAQIVAAGGAVAAVLFAQPLARMAAALAGTPGVAAQHLPALVEAAAALRALRRQGVPVRFGTGLSRIVGEDRVEAVEAGGDRIACDTVGLCFGFVPQSALPRMLGAAMRPAGRAGGWAAEHGPAMDSSVPGLFVAGETTGVAGAPAAAVSGALAAIGLACAAGLLPAAEADRRAAPLRRRRAALLRFADLLDRVADPRPWFPALAPDTEVCRCEEVPLAAITPHLERLSANAIKLETRCGMGPCQGRNCEPTLLRLMGTRADAGFAARFPARPVSIADLAAPADVAPPATN